MNECIEGARQAGMSSYAINVLLSKYEITLDFIQIFSYWIRTLQNYGCTEKGMKDAIS